LLCHGGQVQGRILHEVMQSAKSTPEADCGSEHSTFGHEVAAVETVERRLNNTGQ